MSFPGGIHPQRHFAANQLSMQLSLITASFCILFLFSIQVVIRCQDDRQFNLTILHNNDIHSRFMPTNVYSAPCNTHFKNCYGGVGRTVALVKQIRNQNQNVLFLNAGDSFQGTVWYNLFKNKVVTDFVKMLNFDAITLGNHEFDDGVDGLYPFIDSLSGIIPVICANLDVSREPKLLSNGHSKINSSVVLTRSGVKIGIIGVVTKDSAFLSSPGPSITFLDEIESVKKEVDKLVKAKVNIIIGLSHAGYAKDIEIANSVPEFDIIVGGHTNTFLYSPVNQVPSIEKAVDTYPTVIGHGLGRKTLIVQAFAYNKYLGQLDVTFDTHGNVVTFGGNPILLDSSIPEDEEANKLVDKYSQMVPKEYKEVLGTSAVFLEGEDVICRQQECSLGNLLADMVVHHFINMSSSTTGWTDFPIAIVNSGVIRTSIAPGLVIRENTMAVLPFKNDFEVVTVSGELLMKVLEHSISAYDPQGHRIEGRFLQFSGIKVKYDSSKEVGARVVDAQIRCGSTCLVPHFEPLQLNGTYNILSTTYVNKGGDGFFMLQNATKTRFEQALDIDILESYVTKWSPLVAGREDRIVITNSSPKMEFSLFLLNLVFMVTLGGHFL